MMDVFLSTITKKNIHKSVVIKDHVTIEGPVLIEEGVKIFEGSKIVGPVYIGKHTIVGNNNIIRSSMIGSDCVTGFNTDITRSYIGNNCWFHSNYVGDSILGDDISLGSGAVFANLRLDDGEISSIVKKEKISTGKNKLGAMIGSHVRIGVNASIMPGIKIGSGSFIGSGVILDKDIEDKQFCVGTPSSYTVKANTAVPAASREAFRKGL
jgi:bifunctional UDP-N-acetylglucosamine pyrophosphorylase/glucosamine-1-phosphate N-acetyltransferase